jgi:predicted cobalt transporter CbtA
VFRAVGEGEAVEICVWDAEELGLAALVGPHCYVAVRPARETSSVTKELASSFVGS